MMSVASWVDRLRAVEAVLTSARPPRSSRERSGPARARLPNRTRVPSGPAEQGEQGMATAELAVVLPAIVLVLAFSLGALGLASDQIRCVDAARAGARAASRGDSDSAVILVADRAAPSGSLVSVTRSGDLVRVSVVSRPPMVGSLFPSWLRAGSTASAAAEPSDPQR